MQRFGLQVGSRSAGRFGTMALVYALVSWSMPPQARAFQEASPVGQVLRFEPEELLCRGPLAQVTSLAFDPSGEILYVAGFDKTVRVWKWDQAKSRFVYLPNSTGRVAIGKGWEGVINAMAVSPRGDWLAVGGQGFIRDNSQNENVGWATPWGWFPDEYRKDRGQITVFRIDKKGETVLLKPATAPLRGHRDSILALAVSGRTDNRSDVLASLSGNRNEGWVVHLWEIVSGIDDVKSTHLRSFPVDQKGFVLRLMSWGDGSGVPTSDKNLVIVGADNNGLLHIRIFDAGGNRITDTDETKLPSTQAGAISTLKQQLPGLLPPHVLTGAEKAQVIAEVTSIVDQTHQKSGEQPQNGRPKYPRIAVHCFSQEDIAVAVAVDGEPLRVWRVDKVKERCLKPRPDDELMKDKKIGCLAWTGPGELITSSQDKPFRHVNVDDRLGTTPSKFFQFPHYEDPISVSLCSPVMGAIHASVISLKQSEDAWEFKVHWGPIATFNKACVIGEWSSRPGSDWPTLAVALNGSRLAFYSAIERRITVCDPFWPDAKQTLDDPIGIISDARITKKGIYLEVDHEGPLILKFLTQTITDGKPVDVKAQEKCEIKEGNAVCIKPIGGDDHVLGVFDAEDRLIYCIKPIEGEEHVLGVFDAEKKPICSLFGHWDRIRTVHCTRNRDGEVLLTTTADDRTVNFWKLPKFQEIVKNRRIKDLYLIPAKGRGYVIGKIMNQHQNLQIGDRLQFIEFQDGREDLNKRGRLSKAIRGRKEGEATLVCDRRGMTVRDIVIIEQAEGVFQPIATFVFVDRNHWVLWWGQRTKYLAPPGMGKCFGLHSNFLEDDRPYGGTWGGLIDPAGANTKGDVSRIFGLIEE